MLRDPKAPMTLCLVCDDAVVETAVRACCPSPHQVEVYSRRGLVNAQRTISEHGLAVVEAARSADAVLVDWAFDEAPALNTLCFHVRRALTAPVFMLSREGPDALASCIAAGADDALTFPLYLSYLQAKVFSHRRIVAAASTSGRRPSMQDAEHDTRRLGDLRVDLSAHRFFIRDQEVELTPREFALVAYLMDRRDVLCTRDQILDAVWGIDFDTGTNMVDVYTHFLRKKLEAHGLKGMIETVRGHGYRMVELEAR